MRPNDSRQFKFDVFISYHQADSKWVDSILLPALEDFSCRVATQETYQAGMSKLDIFELALKECFRIILILSPDWIKDSLNNYQGLASCSLDPRAYKRIVLPILLRETELPNYLNILNTISFIDSKDNNKGLNHLIHSIQDNLYIPTPLNQDSFFSLTAWFRWLYRYRRKITINLILFSFLLVLLGSWLNIKPFHARIGWQSMDLPIKSASIGVRFNENLLIANRNDRGGCDHHDYGVINYSLELKIATSIEIPELKKYFPNKECYLVEIFDFAIQPESQQIYAATGGNGLLISNITSLDSWRQLGKNNLPEHLDEISLVQDYPQHIPVNSKGSGLFLSINQGDNWQPVQVIKEDNKQSQKIYFEKIVASKSILFASILEKTSERPSSNDGIYISQDGGLNWNKIINSNDRFYFY